MVQYPINVYPDNGVTFDKNSLENETRLSFTFKGDNLKAYCVRFFDYNTGEMPIGDRVVYDYDTELMQYNILAYNNENVTLTGAFSGLNNVGSYIMQFMLVGGLTNAGGVATDRFVLRGELQNDYVSGETSCVIEDRINSIYEWDTSTPIKRPITVVQSGISLLLNVMEMRVGNESQRILSYNYETGEIVLENYFSNDYEAGTPFQIYANYLVTPQYYFNLAARPQIVGMNAEWDAYGVKFSAVYSQAQYHFLKHYTITMQKKSSSDVYNDIAKTGRIYSQRIEYKFVDDYDYDVDVSVSVADDNERFALTSSDVSLGDIVREGTTLDQYNDKYYYVSDIEKLDSEDGYSRFYPLFGGNNETRAYRFIVEAIGQDGTSVKAYSEDFVAPSRLENVKITRLLKPVVQRNSNVVSINLSGDLISDGVRVYRVDDENIDSYARDNSTKTLIGDFNGANRFDDYTASTHGEYVYMLVPYYMGTTESTEVYRAMLTDKITTNEYGYTITAIHDSGKDINGLPFFFIGDTWKFITVEDTTVTQNTDKTSHSGFGKYSSLTSTQTNFMSGSLSADIGNVLCPNNVYKDDIQMVRAWREFITQDCQYILRSQKGDVWVVNVVGNPTTQYQEDVTQLFTTVEFEWAECCNIKELITGITAPSRLQER